MSLAKSLQKAHHWILPPSIGVGWMPYLWLVYFGFFWLKYVFQTPGTLEASLALLSTAIFLVLYFSAFRRTGRTAVAHVLALVLMGALWAPLNGGASAFFVFAGAFCMLAGPPRKAWTLLAFVMLSVAVVAIAVQPAPWFWLPGLLATFVVGAANIHFAEIERKNAALRLSQAEVEELARVAERERIARDLHDLLGHRLSVIVLKSELAGKLFDRDPEAAKQEISAVEASAREALAEVREAISGYRHKSLQAELEQARMALTSADVTLDLSVDDPLHLSSRPEAVLGLIIKEAVTNIIRHAKAHHCAIRIGQSREDDSLVFEIRDDGQGRIRPEGGGIDGMRARVEAIGGRFILSPEERRIQAFFPSEPTP
ncbi:MAG: sensor histidine kinase [Wenzhouxiangella sp.]|jgi:two-component system sensor histidine kinase DesK|nr:sensor histidine kinase [Wenzhouxiangella sp.]